MNETDLAEQRVVKSISFTTAQWQEVERRFLLSGEKSFSAFVRKTIMRGKVTVRKVTFDPSLLGAELSRIGNNINQIARNVNTNDVASVEELRATRLLVREIQRLIEEAIRDAK